MRSLKWLLQTIIYLLLALPDKHRINKLIRKGDELTARLFIQARVRHWALAMLRYAGVTVDVFGRENIPKGPVLFVPNHQSDWDIMVVETYLDQCGILAKDELRRIPLASPWMELLGTVFIDKTDARKSVRALKECEKRLESGSNFIIFPEGTRSRGEEIGEYKTGAIRVALKDKVPLVPVSIDGTYKIMEANNGKWIHPGHVILTIGKPVESAGVERHAQKEFAAELRRQVLDLRETGRRLYAEKMNSSREAAAMKGDK